MRKEYRNVTKTKKAIKNAFSELLKEKKEIEKITINEIINKADIAKSTFYYHYNDLYSVIQEFEREIIEVLIQSIDEVEHGNSLSFQLFLDKIFDFLKQNEMIYHNLMSSLTLDFSVRKLKYILSKKILNERKNLDSSNINERMLDIRFLTNACTDLIVDYFRGNIDYSLDDVKNTIIKFITKIIS